MIIRPLVRFIGLGETYEAIPEEAEFDPYTYEEAIKDIDNLSDASSAKYDIQVGPAL